MFSGLMISKFLYRDASQIFALEAASSSGLLAVKKEVVVKREDPDPEATQPAETRQQTYTIVQHPESHNDLYRQTSADS